MNVTTVNKTHKLFNDYCLKNNHKPVVAEVDIVWKNDKEQYCASLIKFFEEYSENFIEDPKNQEFPDDMIFYYVTGLDELCELIGKKKSREDFYVSHVYGFY